MQFGRVIGQVIATQKTGKTTGLRLLIVEGLDESLQSTGKCITSVDTVNARHDDIVLVCSSSSARMTAQTKGVAADNAIVGIVESVSAGKKNSYRR
ncbi:EutN/CcmL family microcompartment protein [bacterium]|nr:EutN/CcmL family microcompartment protein [bacterium]